MMLFMQMQNSKQRPYKYYFLFISSLSVAGCQSSPPPPVYISPSSPPVTIIVPPPSHNTQKVSTESDNCHQDYNIKYRECYDFTLPVSSVKRDRLFAKCLRDAGYPEGSETCRKKTQ